MKIKYLFLFSLIFSLLIFNVLAQSSQKKPNVIIILADDLGYGDLGCFGSKDIFTPHLDKLAASGMRLMQFYSATPFCTPTRASIMTGRYPYRFGIKNIFTDREEHLPKGEILLPGILKSAGYTTAHVGKWHLGGLNVKHTLDRKTYPYGPYQFEFDNSITMLEDPALRGVMNREKRLYKDGAKYYVKNDTLMRPSDDHLTEFETSETLKLIEAGNKSGKPFFINFCPFNPHTPLEIVPQKYMDLYAGKAMGDELLYRAMVSQLDGSVGVIMNKLQELGILENTIVIFSSDNGPAGNGSTNSFKGRKRDLYEGGIRVPTIISWKGKIKSGSVSNTIGHSNDLLPTISDLAGVALPSNIQFDGISLKPILESKTMTNRGSLFWFTLFPQQNYPGFVKAKPDANQAVRNAKWKLLAFDEVPVALYNMEKDPSEKNNLLGSEKKITDQLLAELKAWKADSEQRPTFTKY
ncbi:MAG TPA: sulfatase-like hydrolase/transferase [Sphingobacteriaceae bacterium]|nr:sulfatase-like hydrolase/transferase [Sphingobacteriaceae bacterium]